MRHLSLIAGLALLLAACAPGRGEVISDTDVLLTPRNVVLTDQNGRVFRLDSLRGQRMFVFFGYTRCPDVCPMMLAKLSRVYAQLGPDGRAVRTLFISVDPRDTPAELAKYLSYFGAIPATGLTGTKQQIDHAVKEFAASYEIVDSGSAAGPLVNHTTTLYVVDPDGNIRLKFNHVDGPEAILEAMKKVM
jgi:protein SCO1/2